ncbi:MAG: hypothetical protein M3Q39_08165 [Actinomycetota bacterium]|nr:hypothetical protein [Actinomycetota bacterium]
MALDVLLYRPCQRCQQPFLHCRAREPGRLYCGEECSSGAKRERERKARQKYRDSPEGREQHCDEEVRRRERRQLGRVGDRRTEPEQGQLQRVATRAALERRVEEKRDELRGEPDEQVEWLVVAWPGLLREAARLLGERVECPCCDRRGVVVRVVELGREERAEDG